MANRLSDIEFVKAVVSSISAEECSRKTGMKMSSVSARATRMRRLGVKLPQFERKRRDGIDVDSLNSLIEDLQA